MEDGYWSLEKYSPDKGKWVPIEFAREQEIELELMKIEIANLRRHHRPSL